MSAKVTFTGLRELQKFLTDAPKDLRAEGIQIVREETAGCEAEVVQAYPRATGNLAARVKSSFPSSDLLVGIVQSTAPHSHIFEFGTKGRTYRGANRGQMPAANILVPIAQRRRERMNRRLKEMVERRGFSLSE